MSGQTNLTVEFDLLVVALGVWEQVRAEFCRSGRNGTLEEAVSNATLALVELLNDRPQLTVVWRTSGFIADKNQRGEVDRFNKAVIDTAGERHDRLHVIDWSSHIEDRSFEHRIPGDIRAHYGVEPRLVFLQLMTNVLQKQVEL